MQFLILVAAHRLQVNHLTQEHSFPNRNVKDLVIVIVWLSGRCGSFWWRDGVFSEEVCFRSRTVSAVASSISWWGRWDAGAWGFQDRESASSAGWFGAKQVLCFAENLCSKRHCVPCVHSHPSAVLQLGFPHRSETLRLYKPRARKHGWRFTAGSTLDSPVQRPIRDNGQPAIDS